MLGKYLNEKEVTEININIVLPNTRLAALKKAFKNNPSMLVSDFNIKQAKASYKKSFANYYPKVDIELSANYTKNQNFIEGKIDTYKGMLYLSYNLFNGFRDHSTIQKSLKTISKEVQTRENIKRELTQKINTAWENFERLEEQMQYLIKYKDEAKLTMELYAKEFDLGRRSLLDLLTAQNDFINAKAQIIATKYTILQSKFKILDAMGTLVQTILQNDTDAYDKVSLK